ncbi:glycosyltransferase [Candidatus Pelagibacter ubique]|uniref:glycosyltransferase n=1 Tax=Pelagibacter ubique TaxID=198252 RepID=UPI0003C7F0EA
MIKVAFILNFRKKDWLGGYNYYINLFKCLHLLGDKKIMPVIITDNRSEILKDKFFKSYQVIETSLVNRGNLFIRIVQKLLIIFLNRNTLLIKVLKEKGVKCLSHAESLGKKSSIASFPWFPDFQEINLPKNFTFKDKFFRRLNVILATKHSTRIIVSTKSVQQDLKKISVSGYKKSSVIKHNVLIENNIKFIEFSVLKKKYDIKNNFFLVPNHYWQHKNHICILKALKYLKKKGFDYHVISTGLFHDHRKTSHINFLSKYIKKNKLNSNYKILGVIPFIDMLSLMKYSLSVINPSKSEGLSNSVEQAKALAKNVILSNIPVHKEQLSDNFYYFNPNDNRKLASLMCKVAKSKVKWSEKKIKKIQKVNLAKNLNFARSFQELIIKYVNI